ncbi:MAG: hypothetical protein ABSC56_10790 [Solirubrobacteraceae bacterium]|jgi:hypothetical protein
MTGFDPAAEERAEQRARALLRSCVAPDDWAVYERFGFLRVRPGELRYAYLIYPYKPLVAYRTDTHEALGEYCVTFAHPQARLPPSDDVLAKWLALTADERGLIESANVAALGHQLDPGRVRADLAGLAAWEPRSVAS